jgi:isopenicillin N synthase-like dioxygenase
MTMALIRRVPELSLMSYLNGSNNDQVTFVNELFHGLKEYGFIVLVDHPVDQYKVNQAYEMMHEFFNLPLAQKIKYADKKYGKQRGYIPFGLEHAKDNPNPDLKEFWHTGRELAADHEFKKYCPDNVWPDEIAELKKIQMELYSAMDSTSVLLLEAIGKSLDVAPGFFAAMVKDGNSILRTIHYPPVKGHDTKKCVRAAAHGDINLITMMVGATDSGLELLDRDGSWLPVQSAPGQLVVDTGDMMARLTNEVLPATDHRVVNPDKAESTRYSMPFFVHPHPEAMLTCLPACVGEGEKFEPIKAQEFLFQRLREIGLMPY